MLGKDIFLYCRDCNEAHKATPFDQSPIYNLQGPHVREIPADDRRQFIGRHAGHTIEELSSVTEIWLNPQGAIDPMAESFVISANDREFIVLHRSRRSIAEPIIYRVIPRQLALWPSAFDREGSKLWLRSLHARWWRSKTLLSRRSKIQATKQLILIT